MVATPVAVSTHREESTRPRRLKPASWSGARIVHRLLEAGFGFDLISSCSKRPECKFYPTPEQIPGMC